MTTSLTNKTKYWTGDEGFNNEEIRMELYKDFKEVEKEVEKIMKIKQFKFEINLKDNFSQTLKKAVEKSQAVEKEKKRKQIKFAKNIIIIFYMVTFCINLNSIFFSYTQDSKFFLIYNSVLLGINIAFFFLHLIKKKYLNLIFMKR